MSRAWRGNFNTSSPIYDVLEADIQKQYIEEVILRRTGPVGANALLTITCHPSARSKRNNLLFAPPLAEIYPSKIWLVPSLQYSMTVTALLCKF